MCVEELAELCERPKVDSLIGHAVIILRALENGEPVDEDCLYSASYQLGPDSELCDDGRCAEMPASQEFAALCTQGDVAALQQWASTPGNVPRVCDEIKHAVASVTGADRLRKLYSRRPDLDPSSREYSPLGESLLNG